MTNVTRGLWGEKLVNTHLFNLIFDQARSYMKWVGVSLWFSINRIILVTFSIVEGRDLRVKYPHCQFVLEEWLMYVWKIVNHWLTVLSLVSLSSKFVIRKWFGMALIGVCLLLSIDLKCPFYVFPWKLRFESHIHVGLSGKVVQLSLMACLMRMINACMQNLQ